MVGMNLDWFGHGGVVRAKTGGPLMTVVDFDPHYPCEDGSRGGFFCTWVDGMFLHEDVFPPMELELCKTAAHDRAWGLAG